MSHSTPEYLTLIFLTGELRGAVQNDLVPMCDNLVAKYLISPDIASQLRSPMHPKADRAANLIEIIQNKVQQNPQHYHTFIQVLENQGREYYHDILNRLREVYRQNGGNSQQPVSTVSPSQGSTSVNGSEHPNIIQRHVHRTGTINIAMIINRDS